MLHGILAPGIVIPMSAWAGSGSRRRRLWCGVLLVERLSPDAVLGRGVALMCLLGGHASLQVLDGRGCLHVTPSKVFGGEQEPIDAYFDGGKPRGECGR